MNLKTVVIRKQNTPNFTKHKTFPAPLIRTDARAIRGEEIVVFQKIWCALFSCKHSAFCLLTDGIMYHRLTYLLVQYQEFLVSIMI